MISESDAWMPDAEALVALIKGFDNCSHHHLGQWSFWNAPDGWHLSICPRTGKAYWTDVGTGAKTWVHRDEAVRRGWVIYES